MRRRLAISPATCHTVAAWRLHKCLWRLCSWPLKANYKEIGRQIKCRPHSGLAFEVAAQSLPPQACGQETTVSWRLHLDAAAGNCRSRPQLVAVIPPQADRLVGGGQEKAATIRRIVATKGGGRLFIEPPPTNRSDHFLWKQTIDKIRQHSCRVNRRFTDLVLRLLPKKMVRFLKMPPQYLYYPGGNTSMQWRHNFKNPGQRNCKFRPTPKCRA